MPIIYLADGHTIATMIEQAAGVNVWRPDRVTCGTGLWFMVSGYKNQNTLSKQHATLAIAN